MTAIFCDICKKEVPGARKDVNYVTVLEKDLCLSCEERLRISIKQVMAERRPYVFKEYQDLLGKTLNKLVAGR
jgi:hypothetical protein